MNNTVIRRDSYIKRLMELRGNRLIKVVTGLRRSGKSFLLNKLFKNALIEKGIPKERILNIDLESESCHEFRVYDELSRYIKSWAENGKERYLIIDEVQNIRNRVLSDGSTMNFIDLIIGLMHIEGLDIYVTGSNSRMLSSDIATEFRGRASYIHLRPLEYKEFEPYAKSDNPIDEYMTFGGLPYVVLMEDFHEKEEYLSSLIDTTYIRDIRDRSLLYGSDDGLRDVIRFLSSNIGSLTNPSRILNAFKSNGMKNMSLETIKKYVGLFEESFLIDEVERRNVKGLKLINSTKKYYWEDLGLRNARVKMMQLEAPHIMENLIYNELRYRGYKVFAGALEIYDRDNIGKTIRKNAEVDFIAEKGNFRIYIQSAYDINDPDKLMREKRGLMSIKDSFPKAIITMNTLYPHFDEDGIYIMGLKDFFENDFTKLYL